MPHTRTFLLLLVLSALLTAPAFAYEDNEVVGTVYSLQKGTTSPGSRMEETMLGDTAADAIRASSLADVAIVNGGDIYQNLDSGEATWAEIKAVFYENRPLATAVITYAQLWEVLETGVSHISLDENEQTDYAASAFDGFPQVSGLNFTFDPTAPAGERIVEVQLSDGTKPERTDDNTTLVICATEYMLSGAYGYPEFKLTPIDAGLADALAAYFAGSILQAPEMGRINSMGTKDNPIASRPVVLMVAVAAIIISFAVGKGKARLKKENEIL